MHEFKRHSPPEKRGIGMVFLGMQERTGMDTFPYFLLDGKYKTLSARVEDLERRLEALENKPSWWKRVLLFFGIGR